MCAYVCMYIYIYLYLYVKCLKPPARKINMLYAVFVGRTTESSPLAHSNSASLCQFQVVFQSKLNQSHVTFKICKLAWSKV